MEDIGEYTYAVDRMLYQLKRSGKFEGLAGLVIGGFTDMKDTDRPFGKTVQETIRELLAGYQYPICFDFPVSHGNQNHPLKCGAIYQLSVTKKNVRLAEV